MFNGTLQLDNIILDLTSSIVPVLMRSITLIWIIMLIIIIWQLPQIINTLYQSIFYVHGYPVSSYIADDNLDSHNP